MKGTLHTLPDGSREVREKATMEKPEKTYTGFGPKVPAWIEYDKHIESLRTFPAIGFDNVPDGEVEYRLQHQMKNLGFTDNWVDCDEYAYKHRGTVSRRIVAVPSVAMSEGDAIDYLAIHNAGETIYYEESGFKVRVNGIVEALAGNIPSTIIPEIVRTVGAWHVQKLQSSPSGAIKSKEDILKEVYELHTTIVNPDGNWASYEDCVKDGTVQVCLDAMEQYASQFRSGVEDQDELWNDFRLLWEQISRMEENDWEWNRNILKQHYSITRKQSKP